jgi:hypothetical protein
MTNCRSTLFRNVDHPSALFSEIEYPAQGRMGQSEIGVQFDGFGEIRRCCILALLAPFPEVRRAAQVVIIRIKAGVRLFGVPALPPQAALGRLAAQ